MPALYDGDHVEADLAQLSLHSSTKDDVDLIGAFLDELDGNQEALWKLLKRKEDHHSPFFNCQAIDFFQASKYNVYRIRPLSNRLKKYRILYAYDSQRDDFYVLAVVIKALPNGEGINQSDPVVGKLVYDYGPQHSISDRIRNEYEAIGLPRC